MVVNPKHIAATTRLTAKTPSAVLYRVVEVDGGVTCTAEPYPLPDGESKLVAMQRAVGGKVEHIHIGPSRRRQYITYDGWVNDEGALIGLPLGVQVRAELGSTVALFPVSGSLLVTAGESLSGETAHLTPEELNDLVLIALRGDHPWVVAISPELSDA